MERQGRGARSEAHGYGRGLWGQARAGRSEPGRHWHSGQRARPRGSSGGSASAAGLMPTLATQPSLAMHAAMVLAEPTLSRALAQGCSKSIVTACATGVHALEGGGDCAVLLALLAAGDALGVEGLLRDCQVALARCLTPANAPAVLAAARSLAGCSALALAACRVVLGRYAEVAAAAGAAGAAGAAAEAADAALAFLGELP
jgi:hypothetical protein